MGLPPMLATGDPALTSDPYGKRLYDVAVSDGRTVGADARARTPVGSTVDIADASYTNTIGDPLLTAYWVDPNFDASQSAFYYVRVIEIPTPRWTPTTRSGLASPCRTMCQ